jgi:hypothetical protein
MKQGKPRTTPAVPDSETALFERIRELIVTARQTISRGVDLVQVHANFEIGRHIVEFEQQGEARAVYGKAVVQALALRLTSEFGQGFSLSNIKHMRQFFLLYRDRTDDIGQTASDQFKNAKSQTLSGQFPQSIELPLLPKIISFSLSWSHYVFLLGIKNPGERSFYEIEATQQNWTIRELKRQFDSSLFDADHFFVDLVFYNRLLRCYVLIDLKIGKLAHQDLGQGRQYPCARVPTLSAEQGRTSAEIGRMGNGGGG